ncbi:SH2 domain-containing protein [Ditylenchus destructor]|uniref:SH2 domain-containing protein n=1 Tax=Ditylenchus destructor TaxID=166010 RepID=A0AAD4NGH2_9BILA|nr:SH2 domain-containing protein [Ditylenchus destructor]
MSALQDILDKMYVDPELLEQLEEEQKQILFIKMREEQLRRWREREEKTEQAGVVPSRKINSRKIQWLTGRDGEVWVWVMGEHPSDPSIEEILEKETKQKAREMAEKEVLFESLNMDLPILDSALDEQQLKKQLMDVKLDKNAHTNGSPQPLQKRTSYSPYDELGTVNSSTNINTSQSPFQQNASRKSLPNNYSPANLWEGEKQTKDSTFPNGLYSTGNSTFYKRLPSSQSSTNNQENIQHLSTSSPNHPNASSVSYKNTTDPFRGISEMKQTPSSSIRPPPIPEKPPGLRRSSALTGNPALEEFVQYTRSYVPDNSPNNTSNTQPLNVKSKTSNSFSSFPVNNKNSYEENGNNAVPKTGFNAGRGNNVSRLAARLSAGSGNLAVEADASPSGSPKLSRAANNANGSEGAHNRYLPQANNNANNFSQQNTDRESTRFDSNPMLRLRSMLSTQQLQIEKGENKEKQLDSVDAAIRGSLLSVAEEVDKRQSRILEQIKEQRSRMELEAEAEAQKQGKEWEAQERKSREAEAQIRLIAQKAREEHRKNLRTSDSLRPILNDISGISLKEAIKNLPRPPKPQNRRAIIEWYKNVELPNGTGLDPKTARPAVWFHGVISRSDAEELLADRPTGSYLVRVSERIWGYTISYVVGDGTTKHFLVEKILDGYQFLGTNQLVHSTLFELVQYHETAPITPKGKEILMKPVGQIGEVPDYTDLFN